MQSSLNGCLVRTEWRIHTLPPGGAAPPSIPSTMVALLRSHVRPHLVNGSDFEIQSQFEHFSRTRCLKFINSTSHLVDLQIGKIRTPLSLVLVRLSLFTNTSRRYSKICTKGCQWRKVGNKFELSSIATEEKVFAGLILQSPTQNMLKSVATLSRSCMLRNCRQLSTKVSRWFFDNPDRFSRWLF